MASSIDPANPILGPATTASVRTNFSNAKSEIETLQAAVAATTGVVTTGTIELGHASDTTIARSAAGDATIEGNAIYRAGGTDVPVADGGTGRSTGTTAYALVATGTTATGAQQTLAAGATTEILVGGGASALPAWSSAATVRGLLDPVPQVVNAQTDTTYTLVMADKGKLVTFSNGSAIAVTVETSTATWASGDRVDLLNLGAGAVTITGSGVTVSKLSTQTAVLAQYAAASLIFTSDSAAVLVGGMGNA